MEIFLLFSFLITLAAAFSFINVRYFKMPSGISFMLMGGLAAAAVVVVGYFSEGFVNQVKHSLGLINFSEFILNILLCFLLFAGSLHVNLADLKKSANSIIAFATLGTVISTFLVGMGIFFVMSWMGIDMPLIYCLLFGALVSPTDPVAVMSILKKANLSKKIETNIVGESLFNDGIGVVIFVTLLKIASVGIEHFGAVDISLLFLREAAGGLLMGFIIGYIGYVMMKTIDHFQTEILISLAMVMGGYSLCHYLHVSGPLAMVVAGIMTGNRGRALAMSDTTRDYLGKFWDVTDEILNAILFLLIGLEIVTVRYELSYLVAGLLAAIMIVVVRYFSLYIPSSAFRFKDQFGTKNLWIMTWGGLRGGISIALSLSLPPSSYKEVIVFMTFVVVLFSILVQGLTIEKLIRRLGRQLSIE